MANTNNNTTETAAYTMTDNRNDLSTRGYGNIYYIRETATGKIVKTFSDCNGWEGPTNIAGVRAQAHAYLAELNG